LSPRVAPKDPFFGCIMTFPQPACAGTIRRLFAGVALSLGVAAASGQQPVPVRPAEEPPPLLEDAFNKMIDNQGHWAFTQVQTLTGFTAALGRETVFRFDPSKPYAGQLAPLKVEGHDPTDRERREFREIGERMAKRRAEDKRDTTRHTGDELKINLNSRIVTPDLLHATVVNEDATSVTYAVPLREKGAAGTSAFEGFEVTARISKQRREFEHATFRQRAPMRVDVVAKVSDAVIDCEFAPADPAFPAVIMVEHEQATVRILFVKRVLRVEVRRSTFERVTPYDQRFGVRVGPLRTLDF
jgi:hypothetical protein